MQLLGVFDGVESFGYFSTGATQPELTLRQDQRSQGFDSALGKSCLIG